MPGFQHPKPKQSLAVERLVASSTILVKVTKSASLTLLNIF
jgi:hypothetical protein